MTTSSGSSGKPCFEYMPRPVDLIPMLVDGIQNGNSELINEYIRQQEDIQHSLEQFLHRKVCNSAVTGGQPAHTWKVTDTFSSSSHFVGSDVSYTVPGILGDGGYYLFECTAQFQWHVPTGSSGSKPLGVVGFIANDSAINGGGYFNSQTRFLLDAIPSTTGADQAGVSGTARALFASPSATTGILNAKFDVIDSGLGTSWALTGIVELEVLMFGAIALSDVSF